jgi:transposase
MTMPSDDHMSKADVAQARIEIFTGAGRRRKWPAAQKAAILAESYGAVSVCDVARRHGLTPTQLFTWRRTARRKANAVSDGPPKFVPAMIEAQVALREEAAPDNGEPSIGFELGGASVWVCPGADAGMVSAIIHALKAPK